MPERHPDLWTTKQVADMLQVSAGTVKNLVKQEQIAFVKVRNCVRFYPSDVDDYLRRARREAKCSANAANATETSGQNATTSTSQRSRCAASAKSSRQEQQIETRLLSKLRGSAKESATQPTLLVVPDTH